MHKQIDMVLAQGVDGIILAPIGSDREAVERIKRVNLPCVVLDSGGDFGVDNVRSDSVSGAYALTELLLKLGHRRIALVDGPYEHPTAMDRFEGYANALSEFEVSVDESLVLWGPYLMGSGSEATKKLLEWHERPTAIFAANNWLAVGILNELNRHSIQVPEEMAVVAFDEMPSLSSFLTVAEQPADEIGHLAAEMLHERIEGYSGPPREHVLPVDLHIRASSGSLLNSGQHR